MMSSMDQLRRGTQLVALPAGGNTAPAGMGGNVGISANVSGSTVGDGGTGALLVLSGAVVALILFYLWTHSIQGGP
jgi:hypothetical protein